MKKLILIVVLLLLLAGGGLAGAGVMGMGPLAGPLESLLGKKEAKEEPAPAPQKREIEDFYYDLGSFIVPVVRAGAINHQVGVDLAIKVDPKAGPRISSDIPRLQNAITFMLYDFLPNHADSTSAEDRKIVHDRLLKLAVDMYGRTAVRDIIIKSMYER